MGLLDNQTYFGYLASGNLGNYQFTNLNTIINTFMVAYVGEDKIISKVRRTDVQFHAMRAVQELTYDVFKSVKSWEFTVPNNLVVPLPQDYVNYIKISRSDNNGMERILYPANKSGNPISLHQDENGGFTITDSELTYNTIGDPPLINSQTLQNFQNHADTSDAYSNDAVDLEIDNEGRRYGLDPQFAQANGSFVIDNNNGTLHFPSSLTGQLVVFKYVSDGLGTDEEMVVHKFAEEAIYKWIAYGILSVKSNIPPFIIQRFKKEKFAETRKAKIRLSNIKIEEFTQILKGMSKPIK